MNNKCVETQDNKLLEVLDQVELEIGWRGNGPRSDMFYCEHCEACANDSASIKHKNNCIVLDIRAVLDEYNTD